MADRVLRSLAILLSAVHAVFFLYVVGSRFTFPYQLEWMTGSVLDHVERIRAGLPLYTEPTADWIPYIYPPLYYRLAAPFGTSYVACRAISLACALVQAVCAYRLARRLGAPRWARGAAVALFVACFGYTGFWYDIERSDTLYVAMMVAGTTVLVERRTIATCAFAGALLGLGFYAKQPAILFVVAGGAALVVSPEGSRRATVGRAAVFSSAASLAIVVAGALLRADSGPWFEYYVFHVPRAHGVTLALLPELLREDVTTGIGLVASTFLYAWWTARDRSDTGRIVFTAMLLAGFAGAISSRLHIGGWINVLQQWTTFACVAFALVLARLAESRAPRARAAIAGALAMQLALLLYDPRSRAVRPGLEEDTARLHAVVAELEQRGEVLFVGRGHVTKHRHFQMAALADVVQAEGRSPEDLRRALSERRFAAILDDAREAGETAPTLWPPLVLEDIDDLRAPLFSSYFVARRLDDRLGDLAMRAPARPRWVYLPRTKPLEGLSVKELKERQLREMLLAEKGEPPEAIEEAAASP